MFLRKKVRFLNLNAIMFIMIEDRKQIVKKQLEFYAEGLAGCRFAQYAAQHPGELGWGHVVIERPSIQKIDEEIERAVKDPKVMQISIILPNIKTKQDLLNLVSILRNSKHMYFEENGAFADYTLYKLRLNLNGKESWVSGFAPLDFLPKTRQSPFTELVVRVKDKPPYKKGIHKPTPENEVHIANLQVPKLSKNEFTDMFVDSFKNTTTVLGHKADELAAAKVTFAIPN